MAAVVTQCADSLRQLFIICSDGTSIAQRPEVLTGVKAETGCMPPVTRSFAVEFSTVCLRRIFQNQQLVLIGQRHNFGHGSQLAIQMHRHNDFSFARNGGGGFYRAKVVGCCVWFYQHRLESIFGNSQYAGNIGVRWHNDFIAFMQLAQLFPGPQRQRERIQTIGNADAVRCAAVIRKLLLEGFEFLPQDIPAGIYDATGGADQRFSVLSVDGF